MASVEDRPITVTHDGTFRVTYTNTKGESSAFRCTPDVGALFAAAPDLLAACDTILAGPVDEPSIDLTDEYHAGLHCGLEDRDIGDRYDACDYGFEKGVERVLEWAKDVVEGTIAKATPHASRTTNHDSRKDGTDASSEQTTG
ncbi:MAG: hypothetical protein IID41_00475 [Planctomycetes bacterium]|nr:hypothetical protein [Planctomycetota bacterium]